MALLGNFSMIPSYFVIEILAISDEERKGSILLNFKMLVVKKIM